MCSKCIWMVTIDRYAKSGAIAMAVAVVAFFHASEGSFFSLSCCVCCITMLSFFRCHSRRHCRRCHFFFIQFSRNRVNNKLSYATLNEKKNRIRLCNAYYEFLMHSKLKRSQSASGWAREKKRDRSTWLNWII